MARTYSIDATAMTPLQLGSVMAFTVSLRFADVNLIKTILFVTITTLQFLTDLNKKNTI